MSLKCVSDSEAFREFSQNLETQFDLLTAAVMEEQLRQYDPAVEYFPKFLKLKEGEK